MEEDSVELTCERCLRGGGTEVTASEHQEVAAYEVRENAELGRYLVALRDIKPGELVFRAAPIVSGLQAGSVPLCLGCYRPLQPPRDPLEDYFRCPICGWPLCSEDCVYSLRHQPECEATARSGVRVFIRDPSRPDPLYDCVILIRCLMLSRLAPAHGEQLAAMEAHENKPRQPLQRRRARALCALLKSRFGLPAEEKEMLRLLAVLEVNAYEVRMPTTNVQAVYPVACLPEHSCTPNTFRTFERDLSVCVRAATHIREGANITVTYTDTLWATPERRANLFYSKHFLCTCERCADSTELGSYLAAQRCDLRTPSDSEDEEERQRPLCPGPVLPEEPLKPPPEGDVEMAAERWFCGTCYSQRSGAVCRDIARRCQEAVHELDDSEESGLEDYERLLTDLQELVSGSHATVLDVKHTLLHLYSAPLCESTEQLKRKEQLCREVLAVADKLFKGISTLKGTSMFELAVTLEEMVKRDRNQASDHIGPKLLEACRLYSQSLWHLQWQPECQPEWMVAEQAHRNWHTLRDRLYAMRRKSQASE